MKDIYRELTAKYRKEFGFAGSDGSPGADIKVLGDTDDINWYLALGPERINIIESFPWDASMRVLCTGACYGSFLPISERTGSFDILDEDETHREFLGYRYPDMEPGLGRGADHGYDVVILSLIDTPAPDIRAAVRTAAGYLREDGSLILIAANSGALKYMTGAAAPEDGSALSGAELDGILRELSFKHVREYYPLPDAAFAKQIFSGTRLPSAGDFRGISVSPYEERYMFCSEEQIYARLCGSGLLRDFVPAYMAVMTGSDKVYESLPSYVKYNTMRAPEYALKTEIFDESGKAVKTALTREGNRHIEDFASRAAILSEESRGRFDILMPETGENAWGLKYASFRLTEGMDLGRKLSLGIRDGRAPHEDIEAAVILLLGDKADNAPGLRNLDALFENIIVRPDGGFTLIDYEWLAAEPAERQYLEYRMLRYWYEAYSGLLTGYGSMEEFLAEFGIAGEDISRYEKLEADFQDRIRGGMKSLEAQFAKHHEYVEDLQGKLKYIDILKDEVSELKVTLSREREVERLSQNHIRNIEHINKVQQEQLELISARAGYLEKHRSLSSRIAERLISSFDAWAPAGSRKRAFIHLAKDAAKHPVRMLRQLAGGEGRILIQGTIEIGEVFREGGILTLPQCPQGTAPLVSIVIPVYNEIVYTYACVRSIIANTDMAVTPYEVILADDVSTDATRYITRFIRGMVISRNGVNTGFLKNCNQAAAKAKGRYIFFLNNDTVVHEGWLSALTDLMERDDTIGMTGSKLVYPDGRLQEAGGIIWSDASGWNYGRLMDPDDPEYNYVKEVDYISGAAIMIRRSLWEEIGGFDERYAPAYCEDSDLAFEVRKHGKRVVYQPKSVVTHFEGVSNGTDTSGTGLKRYQIVNAEKFREKWAKELKNQQANTGSPNPFTARDRSAGRRCIVVVDHYVPTWDRDAGSRTTYQYLRMFVKKGFNVKFVGDNFLHEEPYTSVLEQLGIEVLYGERMQSSILDWFKNNSRYIDICYLNRPHIAVKYIDFLKKNTDIKCIFYGHDLHYLRLMREYELSGETAKLRESNYWKGVELSVMQEADMVYYPSEVEIAEIHRDHPGIRARAITAYLWDEFRDDGGGCMCDTDKAAGSGCGKGSREGTAGVTSDGGTADSLVFGKGQVSMEAAFARRKDLLFVGGFKHPPNADAVEWFAAKIFPAVRAAIPGIRFLVAGSGADERIRALADGESGIEVLGFVSDERLEELYATARLTVVPLRYGAGVKGKVVEAIYNGSAVVTTPVGAEGIPDAEDVLTVVDGDADPIHNSAGSMERKFAEAVISLYNDPQRCASISLRTGSYIRQHYSLDAAWSVIAEDFE